MVRIQLIKCIQDESAVGIKEIELEHHRPLCVQWVFNNGDQTLNTTVVPVQVLV